MPGKKDKGQRKKELGEGTAAPFPPLVRLFPFSFVLFPWALGCAGDNHVADDPLVGGAAPAVAQAAQKTGPAGGAQVPPLPVASSAVSLASLAGGKPLPGGRDLSIEEPRDRLTGNRWDGPGKLTERPAAGATLEHPQPIVPVSRNVADPAHGSTVFDGSNAGAPKGNGTATYEQLLAQLTFRGMNWYRQEKWGEGVKFECTFPVRDEPSKHLSYEAVAGSGAEALQAILDKLEKEP
jgi:hypothetical protein